MACKSLDGQVAVPTDDGLRKLLDEFVCVRLVQMHGVDLKRFQFDFNMTWAVFYMNVDGTIYGRYGTRSAMREHSDQDISVAGFKESMQGALRLHSRYRKDAEATRPELAGKQTRHPPRWDRPEKIPALAQNPRMAKKFSALSENRNERAHGVGCIHCHMVASSELRSLRLAEEPVPERLLWPYPMPQAIGMQMDPERRATVRRVIEGSAAARAGVQTGDEVLRFDGQAILSTADIQWVLHNAPGEAKLPLEVRRGDETRILGLELSRDWRRRLGNWRFTNMGQCMQVAGFQGRPGRGGDQHLAIVVQRVHPKRLTGIDLRKDDVVVAIDGKREPMNLGQLTQYLMATKPGSEIQVTRRRRGEAEPKTVRLKVQ